MKTDKPEKQPTRDTSKELTDEQLKEVAGGYLPFFEQADSRTTSGSLSVEGKREI